jgi:SsrA-binding protein
MAKPPSDQNRVLSANRRAAHDYFLLERFEAGLVLSGTEVKAAREGKVQLQDGYVAIEGGEAWLRNAHISHYSHGNLQNHDPVRSRKLLLHREEIHKLIGKTREKGLTLIPLRFYLKKGRIKCELALAKGKKLHDKRETERMRTAEAEAREAIRSRRTY